MNHLQSRWFTWNAKSYFSEKIQNKSKYRLLQLWLHYGLNLNYSWVHTGLTSPVNYWWHKIIPQINEITARSPNNSISNFLYWCITTSIFCWLICGDPVSFTVTCQLCGGHANRMMSSENISLFFMSFIHWINLITIKRIPFIGYCQLAISFQIEHNYSDNVQNRCLQVANTIMITFPIE